MNITVSGSDLLDSLRKVLSVVSTRSTLPILNNILLEAEGTALTLSTTDLEVSISTELPAGIKDAGEITLPARKFGQIVGALPGGDVTIETDSSASATISSGRAVFKIKGLDASEFPRENGFQEDRKLVFKKSEFGGTLRKIAYSASSDQTRYVLTGILLSIRDGNFVAVATDGRRLALVERDLEDADSVLDGDVILPSKAVNELLKLIEGEGEVLVRLSEAKAVFSFDNTVLSTKLVDGAYPNYRQVIPTTFKNNVVLPRETFAEVLNRVSIVLTDPTAAVRMNLEGNALSLSASSVDLGEATEPIEVSYEGDSINFAFNPSFLLEPLRTLESDELTMRFNDEYKPILITADEGFLYVIMPMRQ